jgi:hypothetical protein
MTSYTDLVIDQSRRPRRPAQEVQRRRVYSIPQIETLRVRAVVVLFTDVRKDGERGSSDSVAYREWLQVLDMTSATRSRSGNSVLSLAVTD